MIVVGIDVSKSSVTCHALNQYPQGGLLTYWSKSRSDQRSSYPAFYANPKLRQRTAFDFAAYIKEIRPDYAALEPTGVHLSKLWATILESLGVKILWVGHVQLRRYRGGKNLPNKSDPADALALAAYPFDPEHLTEKLEINPRYYLLFQTEPISRIRDLCQQLEHLARVQSPIVNYARQLMSWQFPEVAYSRSRTTVPGNLPPLWGWLAGDLERVAKRSITILDSQYQDSIAPAYGLQIEPHLRLHAKWMGDIYDEESRIEEQLKCLLALPEFAPYLRVFEQFPLGNGSIRIRARLLSRIYPFESFLSSNGKVVIERETREVSHQQRTRHNRKTVVNCSRGEVKRIKRNRSRDSFKMRLGLGTVLEQSGDALIEKGGGSQICRMSLWQSVLCLVETDQVPNNEYGKALLEFKDKLKGFVHPASGEQMLDGTHIQAKLMSKLTNLMFKEFVRVFAKSSG